MSVNLKSEHLKMAESLVDETRSLGGLAPVDLERFWRDQEVAQKDPFGAQIPQVAFGALLNWECVFDELGIPQDFKRYEDDPPWRYRLNRAYNDLSERIVGRRLLDETPPEKQPEAFRGPKELHELFEGMNVWEPGSQSWWLQKSAHSEAELRALLDRVERRLEDPRAFFLPPDWDATKKRLLSQGRKVPAYGWQRGPVTLAMSLFGVEELIYLIEDEPDLASRFRDLILKGILAKWRLHGEEAGHSPHARPRGFHFNDDNCAMLNAPMYEAFGFPILKGVWEVTSPDPKDRRTQHSDSDMAHLLPLLGRLDLNWTNFGPNVMVDAIRLHLPHAVIYGELAPFTYSRNEETNMVAEFLRDHELTRVERGLHFATAGSINNGSRLTGMRLLMAAIQRWGRF
ncbi:MAG: hypothetical protein J0L75_18770 [Spirochaetes bacterium]|nr:hypothetical protein [Spirochaetota bacterium]